MGKKCKRRYDNVVKKLNCDLCNKNGPECTDKWYEHAQEGAMEYEEVNLLRDNVQCYKVI